MTPLNTNATTTRDLRRTLIRSGVSNNQFHLCDHGQPLCRCNSDSSATSYLRLISSPLTSTLRRRTVTGDTISSIAQIEDEYIVRRRVEEHRLNAGLQKTSTKHMEMDAPGWKTIGRSHIWQERGTRMSSATRQGKNYPDSNIPDGHQARAPTATITDITTFTYRRNPHHSMSILPISIATCHERIWTTVNLEDTPTEAF